MAEPIKLLKRQSMGMGDNLPKFDKIEDFKSGMFARCNPLLMHNYGRNVYKDGKVIGYALFVRIQGYRGLPLNTIKALAFEVDGKWIPDECKYVKMGDREYPFSDIATGKFDNECFWRYTDYLRVFFDIPGGIEQGVHKVIFGLNLRDHYSTTAYCEKDVTIV